MHIALADSSAGDRKQMERLLDRESDRRINTTGSLYIETFGSSDSLYLSPRVYDAYFLDVTDEGNNSVDIAKNLREKGIGSPIIFCISSIDYRKLSKDIDNCLYIDKPIKVAELSELIDKILQINEENYIPKIEFRDSNNTFYLDEKDILYMVGGDYYVDIYLSDGTKRDSTGFIEDVWRDTRMFDNLLPANNKTLINTRYVVKMTGFVLTMTDGTKISVGPQYWNKLRLSLKK